MYTTPEMANSAIKANRERGKFVSRVKSLQAYHAGKGSVKFDMKKPSLSKSNGKPTF
jgi:hypothetical protein